LNEKTAVGQESVVDSLAIAQGANASMAIRLDIQNLTDEGYDLLECDLVV